MRLFCYEEFVWLFIKRKKKKSGARYLGLCPQDESMKTETIYEIALSTCSRINLETGTLSVKPKGLLIFLKKPKLYLFPRRE